MKKISIISVVTLLLLLCFSCRHNRLKTNQKELANEILIQEKEKNEPERIAHEKESPEARTKLSASLRNKEIRSADPGRPPIRLDIMGTRTSIRKFNLSDVASSVRYVKLEIPTDTMLLFEPFLNHNSLISSIQSEGENIIIQNMFGLTRFTMQGEYQETIWKNETGISISAGMVGFGGEEFFGVMPNIPATLLNGDLYYSFQNGPAGTWEVMKYKPGTNKDLSVQSRREIKGPDVIHGDTLFSTNIPIWRQFERVFGTGPDSWVGINKKWEAGSSGTLLVTFNNSGDTLCQFTDYDRIVNFSHGNYRTPAKLISYNYDQLVTIKQEYNDTVFRLMPPNRLLPVYVIDFGEYKVNCMDGLNPDFDLSEKYMLYSLHETNDFLFIRYTQNHNGTTKGEKNAVKFYNAIFFKKEGKLYHHPGFTLKSEGLNNDLDGGAPFWPEFITPQGEMMKLVSGKMMKDYLSSEAFIKADIPGEQRQKVSSMISGLKPADLIIMTVK